MHSAKGAWWLGLRVRVLDLRERQRGPRGHWWQIRDEGGTRQDKMSKIGLNGCGTLVLLHVHFFKWHFYGAPNWTKVHESSEKLYFRLILALFQPGQPDPRRIQIAPHINGVHGSGWTAWSSSKSSTLVSLASGIVHGTSRFHPCCLHCANNDTLFPLYILSSMLTSLPRCIFHSPNCWNLYWAKI